MPSDPEPPAVPNPASAVPPKAPRPSPAVMPPKVSRPSPAAMPRREASRPAGAAPARRTGRTISGRDDRPLVDKPGLAAGPLGRVLSCDGGVVKLRTGYQLDPNHMDGNALVVMRRVAFCDQSGIWKDGRQALLAWARDHRLGQAPRLLAEVAARRGAAVAARVASGRRRGVDVVHQRREVAPEWRLVTGIGERANPNEIGITLHGTYGWPMIPGSTLKGAARAWAAMQEVDVATIDRILGPPPQGNQHRSGTVDVLDALPAGPDPVRVVIDGVTPHVQDYYSEKDAPGEWHNPVPSAFLAVCRGSFAIDLIGPSKDVEDVAKWCAGACDDLGIGAKTGAGYGYLTVQGLTEE